MKVPSKDYTKYSFNLKIFKLQTPSNTTIGEKKLITSSSATPAIPTLQNKKNSWRNAWKLATAQTSKNKNFKNSSSTDNNYDTLEKDIENICCKPDYVIIEDDYMSKL